MRQRSPMVRVYLDLIPGKKISHRTCRSLTLTIADQSRRLPRGGGADLGDLRLTWHLITAKPPQVNRRPDPHGTPQAILLSTGLRVNT